MAIKIRYIKNRNKYFMNIFQHYEISLFGYNILRKLFSGCIKLRNNQILIFFLEKLRDVLENMNQ